MFDKLFDYTDWANQLFINVIIDENVDHAVINRLMCHALNAHYIWNCRILSKVPEIGIWEEYSQSKWIEMNKESMENTRLILKERDLDEMIKYQNSEGKNFENKLSDLLFHIVNHASHHRPQVALLMRQSGYDPPKSDYIYYVRQIA